MTAPQRTPPPSSDLAVEALAIRRLARALVGVDGDADDLAQEAWLTWATRRDHGGGAPARLVGLIRSLAYRRRRGEARRRLREAAAARPEALPSAADTVARVEVARRAVEALEALPEPYRTTLVLRFLEDVPAAEIARRTGVLEGTVRSRIRRGLEQMRADLDTSARDRSNWLPALTSFITRGHEEHAAPASALALPVAPWAYALPTMTKLTSVVALTFAASLLLWLLTKRADSPTGEPGVPGSYKVEADLTVAMGTSRESKERLLLTPADAAVDAAPEVASIRNSDALSSDVRIHARILTNDGLPLTGARFFAAAAPDDAALSDAEGRATLPLSSAAIEQFAGAAPAEKVLFHFSAAGYAPAVQSAALERDSDEVHLGDILLRAGGAVRGRVVDAYGLGVPDALVVYGGLTLEGIDDARRAEMGPMEVAGFRATGLPRVPTTRTDVDGAFRFDGVPVGYGVAWAHADSSLWAHSPPIGLRAGEVNDDVLLTLVEAPARVVAGRVMSPRGAPVPGALVLIGPHGSDGLSQVVNTDHRGRFHCVTKSDEPKDVRVQSLHPEWDELLVQHVLPGTHDLVLRFTASVWLTIVPRSPGGEPIPGAAAALLPPAGSNARVHSRNSADADPQGRVRLRMGATPFRVRVTGPGYRDAVLGPFDPATWIEPLEVMLEALPALVGRVLRDDGSPAAGARVSLHRGASLPRESSGPWTHDLWQGDGEPFEYALFPAPIATATADGDGLYRLPLPGIDARHEADDKSTELGLANRSPTPGTVSLLLARLPEETPWYVHARASHAATVTSGPHVFDGSVEVTLDLQLPPGGAIDGRLEVTEPRRPSGWTMYATDGLAQLARAKVADDGTFRFDHLHAGAWQLAACEPGQQLDLGSVGSPTPRARQVTVEVQAGVSTQVTHRARVRARARLVGRLSIDGAAPGPCRVDVSTAERGAISKHALSLDPDGAFEVDVAPTEEGRISVHLERARTPWSIIVNRHFERGENLWSCELASATLQVTVDANAVRSSSATYTVEAGDTMVVVRLQTSSEGKFGPFTAPAGRGTFKVGGRLDEPPLLAREIELAPGASEHIDLR